MFKENQKKTSSRKMSDKRILLLIEANAGCLANLILKAFPIIHQRV